LAAIFVLRAETLIEGGVYDLPRNFARYMKFRSIAALVFVLIPGCVGLIALDIQRSQRSGS
jgi:hypothetical protein